MTRTQLRLIIKALILKRPGSMFFFFVCDRNAFPTSSRMVIEQQKEPRRNFWVTATSRQLLPLHIYITHYSENFVIRRTVLGCPYPEAPPLLVLLSSASPVDLKTTGGFTTELYILFRSNPNQRIYIYILIYFNGSLGSPSGRPRSAAADRVVIIYRTRVAICPTAANQTAGVP